MASIPCRSVADFTSMLKEDSTCNNNMQIILIAVVLTFLLGSCFTGEKKELIGNTLLIVGQILITLSL